MGIFERIEDVIKSYLNDQDRPWGGQERPRRGRERPWSGGSSQKPWGPSPDPDLEAAFDELNDFLSGGSGKKTADFGTAGFGPDERYGRSENFGTAHASNVPDALRQDFAELGLSPGASAEECKAAYKQLLQKHHPDRHAGHAGNLKKATEKSTRINAAYDRIERWRRTGRVE